VLCTAPAEGPNADGKPAVAVAQFVQQPRVSTFQAETTIKIPKAKSALLSGWTHQREVHNDPVPSIAAVPYVGQLLAAMASTKQKEQLLVLVTPRIVVTQEKEEKQSDVSAEQEEPKAAEVLPAPRSEPVAVEYVPDRCVPPQGEFAPPKPPLHVVDS